MIENANIWQVSTPDEAATVLLSIYETRAEEIALFRASKADVAGDQNTASFWENVQSIITHSRTLS